MSRRNEPAIYGCIWIWILWTLSYGIDRIDQSIFSESEDTLTCKSIVLLISICILFYDTFPRLEEI